MYVRTYVCKYVFVYDYVRTYIRTYVCTCVRTRVRVYERTRTCTHHARISAHARPHQNAVACKPCQIRARIGNDNVGNDLARERARKHDDIVKRIAATCANTDCNCLPHVSSAPLAGPIRWQRRGQSTQIAQCASSCVLPIICVHTYVFVYVSVKKQCCLRLLVYL